MSWWWWCSACEAASVDRRGRGGARRALRARPEREGTLADGGARAGLDGGGAGPARAQAEAAASSAASCPPPATEELLHPSSPRGSSGSRKAPLRQHLLPPRTAQIELGGGAPRGGEERGGGPSPPGRSPTQDATAELAPVRSWSSSLAANGGVSTHGRSGRGGWRRGDRTGSGGGRGGGTCATAGAGRPSAAGKQTEDEEMRGRG
ncbi:unnamed protein product [Urochloa humidicola]